MASAVFARGLSGLALKKTRELERVMDADIRGDSLDRQSGGAEKVGRVLGPLHRNPSGRSLPMPTAKKAVNPGDAAVSRSREDGSAERFVQILPHVGAHPQQSGRNRLRPRRRGAVDGEGNFRE